MVFNGNMPPLAKWAIQLGVPAVIALYMVWLMGIAFTNKLDSIASAVQTNTIQTQQLQIQSQQLQSQIDVLIQLHKYTCLHQASDLLERNECYEASRR